MRNGKKVEDLILKRLDNIDRKLDDVLIKEIPQLKLDSAVQIERTSRTAKVITLAGGAIAVLTSLAIALFK